MISRWAAQEGQEMCWTKICWEQMRVGINPTPTNLNEMHKLALMLKGPPHSTIRK